MTDSVKPRALPNFGEEESEVQPIGLLMTIDPKSRGISGFKVMGTDKFPVTTNELIGWLEICKASLVNRVTSPEQEGEE